MAKSPTKATAGSKSRTRATAARKTSTSLKEVAEAATPTVVDEVVLASSDMASDAADSAMPDMLRKKELIDAVVDRAGVKKRDAKPAIEAALAIIGETLLGGRGLNIPELGKVKLQNSKDVDGVKVLNLRMRRKLSDGTEESAETDSEGLAEPAE